MSRDGKDSDDVSVSADTREQARRPADRRQRIVSAARRLFVERGYHNVSLVDVADAVGIRAPSLYRHFRNKQDLLLHVVSESIDAMVDVVDVPDLDTMLHAAAAGSVVDRGSATLWQREARNLTDDERAAMRVGVIRVAERVAELVGAARPDITQDDARLLAWALMSIFGSVATHKVTLSRRRFETLLVRLASATAHVELGATTPGSAGPATHDDFANQFVNATGRERLLAEAIRLFDERGFGSVSNVEIGVAAGMSGPSIYKHFQSKADLLAAAVFRANERRTATTSTALARARTPDERLDGLLTGYVDFALQHSHLLGVYVSELDQLPDRERRAAQQAQRDHIALWCEVLEQVRPGLDRDEARIVVAAALCTIDDMVRTGHAGRRPDLADRLTEVCRAVLLAEDVEP